MGKKKKGIGIDFSRREFLARLGGSAIGLAGLSALGASCAGGGAERKSGAAYAATAKSSESSAGKPTVVVARDPGMWNGQKLDRERVRDLVFKAVRKLTGAGGDKEAWSAFFKPDDRVSLKLNTISGRILSTTPAVAEAVAAGVMLAGVPGGKIAVWDRYEWELRAAGFKPGRDKNGVTFTATDSPSVGYDSELTVSGEVGSLLSRMVSRFSTALVNVPVLKDHDLVGVSGALKNNFGSINNPNKLHENGCDPYVADLNAMPAFRDRTRLIVMDATTAQYHGGPGYKPKYAWRFSGVIVGSDPVAVDTVAYKLIEEKRKTEGLPTIEEEGRPPKYLKTAADGAHRLGEGRPDKIRIIET